MTSAEPAGVSSWSTAPPGVSEQRGGAPIAGGDAISADLGSGPARCGGQLFAALVVRVDDGDARCWIDRAVK